MEKFEELKELCIKHDTKVDGIEMLVHYYQTSLGWTRDEAIDYFIKLFKNGTIDKINIIGGKQSGRKNR